MIAVGRLESMDGAASTTNDVDSTWQHKLLLASSRYMELSDDREYNSEAWKPWEQPFDNTSTPNICGACFAEDKPLWWLVLRWLKMMLLKMARSYHAKPVLLIIAPLMVGIYIGYWLGIQSSRNNGADSSNRPQSPSLRTRTMNVVRDLVSAIGFRTMAWLGPPRPQKSSFTLTREGSMRRKAETQQVRPPREPFRSSPSSSDSTLVVGKEDQLRNKLRSDVDTQQESGVEATQVPQHVAVIMDGNRRYGKAKYGSVAKGHWDGSSKLVEFAKWCIAEKVQVLTVYAFSTENWNRNPSEVASLMTIFAKYCDELRVEALQRNIRIYVLSTDMSRIPSHVKDGLRRLVDETRHCTGMVMNICMSYGSRGEIIGASRSIARDVADGVLDVNSIDEDQFQQRLLTNHCGDPDVLIRTSGEVRISNFLLWQLAYTEFFFIDRPWPALEKQDLIEVIQNYARGRKRRYGK